MPINSKMITRPSQLAERNARPVRAGGSRERSYSEEIITPEIAITVSAVISIITIMSQDLASLPLLLYTRRGRNKFRAYDSAYYRLMHEQPNSEMTSMIFRELMMAHLLAWGNFYAQIIIDNKGAVSELWPLRPDRMTVSRVEGQKVYTYQQSDAKPRVFMSDEILHIPAFGFDGLIGYSRIALARNAIGLSISTEKYGGKFFSNGANFDIAIMHPNSLGDDAFNHLNDSIKEKHAGIENSHKPMILEEGMTIEKIGIPPDDAQFLETRKFQLAEINRIIGPVPPHMIGDVTNSTSWGTGIDSQEQGYVNHTLRPYAVRTEQALNTQLLLPADREQGLFYEHLFDGLLRGDIQTRFESYVKAINNGVMSPNEVRAKENLNPYNGGDVYWKPLNMASSSGSSNVDQSSASAMTPLWRDAVARVVRREANDLSGASKRYQVKGQQDAFYQWADNFYGVDHVDFMQRQFKPLIQAQKNLFDVDCADALDEYIHSYLEDRRKIINTNVEMSVEEITDQIMSALSAALEVVNE